MPDDQYLSPEILFPKIFVLSTPNGNDDENEYRVRKLVNNETTILITKTPSSEQYNYTIDFEAIQAELTEGLEQEGQKQKGKKDMAEVMKAVEKLFGEVESGKIKIEIEDRMDEKIQ